MANPDIETAQRLFKFPGIGLLVVTGGEAVVEAARKHTNKRLIAAGAGNPPVVVDETADLARAAQSIVKGASFDNNIICADEKVLIVVDSVADELMRLMEGQHAVKLTAEQAQQLQPVLLKNIDERGKGTVSRDWVGRDAAKIAAAIGLNVPQETRLLFVETTAEHPFAVTELMMPVLPVVRVANVADAIALAVKLEGGCHHTAAMHSRNIENMNQMANAMLLPTVMEFNRMVCRERFSQIGRALRTKKSDDHDAINAVSELIAEVGIGKRLGDVGATSAHYGAWAQAAQEDICLRSNPRTASLEQIVGLYAAAQ